MSMAFLSAPPAGEDGVAPLARSPMERPARTAGARFAVAAGWNVAVSYGAAASERAACAETVGWADVSHGGKLELQGPADQLAALGAELAGRPVPGPGGQATRIGAGWWCPLATTRVLVLLAPGDDVQRSAVDDARSRVAPDASVVDLTSALAALVLVGPRARDVIAGFCALDLRPANSEVGSLHPGSIGRTPGTILHEGPERFRLVFGSALGEYMWAIVADGAEPLGGRPVGQETLAELDRDTDGTIADA